MSEKKITFTAQDNVSQKASQMYNNITAAAAKQTSNQKEQNALLTANIKLLKEKLSLEEAGVGKMFKEAGKMAPGAGQQSARIAAKDAEKNLAFNKGELNQVIALLTNLVSENKKASTTAANAEKEQSKNRKQAEDFKVREESRREVQNDPKSIREKIKKAEANIYEGLDEEGIKKLKYQKTLLPQEDKKGGGVFGQVFAGTLAAGIVQQVAAAMGKIIGTQSGEQAANSLLGGIPIVGGVIGGSNDRTFNEQYGIQTKSLGLRALTGSDVTQHGSGSLAESLGYSNQESLDLQGSLIRAAGKGSGENQTVNSMNLQKGLGLSTDVITQIVKDLRTTRSSADVMQIASDVLKANPELRKDQTKFAEILQQTSQLTNQLASQSENTNISTNAGMVGALRGIGGSFADPALGPQRMMAINQALTSPNNDYQKARSFGVLSGMNPSSSYFQLLEAQEKGIGSKGYLTGTLRQLKRETGGGENFMQATMNNLGLGASTSRKLVEAFEKNPAMFDSFKGGTKEIEQLLNGTGRAEANVAQKDKDKAILDNSFAVGALDGTLKVLTKTVEALTSKISGLVGGLSGDAVKSSNSFGVGGFVPGSNPLYYDAQ